MAMPTANKADITAYDELYARLETVIAKLNGIHKLIDDELDATESLRALGEKIPYLPTPGVGAIPPEAIRNRIKVLEQELHGKGKRKVTKALAAWKNLLRCLERKLEATQNEKEWKQQRDELEAQIAALSNKLRDHLAATAERHRKENPFGFPRYDLNISHVPPHMKDAEQRFFN